MKDEKILQLELELEKHCLSFLKGILNINIKQKLKFVIKSSQICSEKNTHCSKKKKNGDEGKIQEIGTIHSEKK